VNRVSSEARMIKPKQNPV